MPLFRKTVQSAVHIEALHSWPDAPENRKYLRYLHRHDFTIVAIAPVEYLDREIEFHDLEDSLRDICSSILQPDKSGMMSFGRMSCEMIADKILHKMPSLFGVEVWEDRDHGAKIWK
jgi:hypothetical protein